MTQDRDEWLMGQVATGRQEALEPLVRRHAHGLLTFIRRMIGNHHRSEEVFQDVFVAVWKKRKTYQIPRPFKPWLYAIAVNRCRAELRRRRPFFFQVEEAHMISFDDAAGNLAVASEQANLVLAAVGQLPDRQRAVVSLRTWSGLSYAEIAEALGRTEGTVRAQMHQALVAMRRYLEPRMRESARRNGATP